MKNANEKSIAAYNRKAHKYESTPEGQFTRKFRELLLSKVILQENNNVLDVACGNSALLAAINKQIPINGFGIDIADQMIIGATAGNPDMEFYTAGCEDIPFADNSMDVITVSVAYHHFPDMTAFAKEAERVLKPKGQIFIADVYLPAVLRLILNPFVPLSKAGDIKFYSPKEIVKTLKYAGLEMSDVEIAGHIQLITMHKP